MNNNDLTEAGVQKITAIEIRDDQSSTQQLPFAPVPGPQGIKWNLEKIGILVLGQTLIFG